MPAPLDIEIEIATWDEKFNAWVEPHTIHKLSAIPLPPVPAPQAGEDEWLRYDRATLAIRHGIETWSWRYGNATAQNEVMFDVGSLGILVSTRAGGRGWSSSWTRVRPLVLAVCEAP